MIFVLQCDLCAALFRTIVGPTLIAVVFFTQAGEAFAVNETPLSWVSPPATGLHDATLWILIICVALLAAIAAVFGSRYLLRSLTVQNGMPWQSGQLLETILGNSPDIVLMLDTEGRIVYISHTDTGYHTPEQLLGRRMADLAIPEDRERLRSMIDQTIALGRKQLIEAAYLDPSGAGHNYDLHFAPVLHKGTVTGLCVVARDIDRERAAEQALRREQNFSAAVLETIGALVVVMDARGCIIRFNQACEQVTGYRREDVDGKYVWDFLLAPEERESVIDVFNRLTAGQFPNTHTNDWIARDGSRRRIAWSNTVLTDPDHRVTYVIATGLDITGQSRTEAALIQSEERMRLSQHYARIGTWEWEIASGALYWSEQIGPLFGYRDAIPETTYENFLNAIHPEDRQRVIDAVNDCIQNNLHYEIEHRVVWPDGTIRWLLERGDTLRTADGKPLRMLGVVQDVTEHKQSLVALTESEELFREMAENTKKALWVRDLRSNRMIYVNPAYTTIWGRPVSALLDNPLDFLECIHPDDRPEVLAAMQQQDQGEYFNRRYRIIRPDGEVRWVHAQVFPIRDQHGTVYRLGGFAEDVTLQLEADAAQLVRERRQVLTLVQEVHHRIKNHLQGIAGLLHQHADQHPEVAKVFDNAIAQVRSIALAHGLQGQGAGSELHLCELLPAIVQSIAAAMNAQDQIEFQVDMDWSLRLADMDTVPLALIFNELIVNCLKHRPARAAPPSRLLLHERDGIARLRITCPQARLPDPFDFEKNIGLGTGLELVKALLPQRGASLTIQEVAEGVACEMILETPVVLRGTRHPVNT